MKRLLLISMCSLALHGTAKEFDLSTSRLSDYVTEGMEASGFRIPQYGEDGRMEAQLFAEHARVLKSGEIEITNVKIEKYKEGLVEISVFSPLCLFNYDERSVYSSGRVLIEMGSAVSLVGKGFTCSLETMQFDVMSEAKVIVRNSAENFKGLGSHL